MAKKKKAKTRKKKKAKTKKKKRARTKKRKVKAKKKTGKKTKKKARKKIKKKKVTKKKKITKVKRKKKPKRKATRKKKKKTVKKKKTIKKKVTKKKPKKVTTRTKKESPSTANLMVTYDPNHRSLAEAEIADVFKRINEELRFLRSEIEGVFKVRTSKPRAVVKKLAKLCLAEPDIFKMTYQYVPIDTWCASDIKEMQNIIRDLETDIKSSEKWKMTLNKRSYDMPAIDLIMALTDVVDKPRVDLKNPEKVIRVEIFGDKAGIALLKADESLSVIKLKGSGATY